MPKAALTSTFRKTPEVSVTAESRIPLRNSRRGFDFSDAKKRIGDNSSLNFLR